MTHQINLFQISANIGIKPRKFPAISISCKLLKKPQQANMSKEAKLEALRMGKESELTQLLRWEKFIERLRRYNEKQKREEERAKKERLRDLMRRL